MFYIALLFLSALAVSGIAGYFSILGLMAIFPGSPIPVAIMGATLEVAKLVTASWIYRNWKQANLLLKSYFTFAVILLSLITSIGIFGYLSKAHIEHTTVGGSSQLQIAQLESKKTSAERRLKNAQTSLDTLDRLTTAEDVLDANFIRNRQKRERATLDNEIKSATADIETIETDLIPLKTETLKLEAEVGPIKYVAEMFYGSGDGASIDKAVRMMIMLLIFVFDPLAILLVIAANISILSLTKPEEESITDNVVLDDTPKKKRRRRKKPVKEVVVENETDFFSMEKYLDIDENELVDETGSFHGMDHVRNKLLIDKSNVRKM
jgi:hypothetical protein